MLLSLEQLLRGDFVIAVGLGTSEGFYLLVTLLFAFVIGSALRNLVLFACMAADSGAWRESASAVS
jgi:hypothetical protein